MAVSGQQKGRENVERLRQYLDGFKERGEPLPRRAGQVNLTEVARSCGFDRQVLHQNDAAKELLREYEEADRAQHLTKLEQAQVKRESKAKDDKDRAALEGLVLKLQAENARLRVQLRRFEEMERVMTETGRLPS
jgi:hypothetical protein